MPRKGSTSNHKVDLIVKRSEKSRIFIFRYRPLWHDFIYLIFSAIDIKRDHHQKVIFVYYGEIKYKDLEVLNYYHDAVISVEKFGHYIRNELLFV
jgi:hypothetical protein